MTDTTCTSVIANMDAYLDRALAEHARRQVTAHLGECTGCAGELNSRAGLRSKLRGAVNNEPVPVGLESRIRQAIKSGGRSGARPTYFARVAIPIAAMFAIGIGLSIAYQLGHLRLTVASQEAYIRSISDNVPMLMRVGLGDHVHCTVFRKFPKNPPTFAKMAGDLGPDYEALLPAVSEHIAGDYRIVMGHRCSYHRRKFVHLAMTNGSHLVSLVIAKRGEGEAFRSDLRSILADGIPMYRTSIQRFSIAAFETRDHLVYIVSDLGQDDNSRMLASVTPSVRAILIREEGA